MDSAQLSPVSAEFLLELPDNPVWANPITRYGSIDLVGPKRGAIRIRSTQLADQAGLTAPDDILLYARTRRELIYHLVRFTPGVKSVRRYNQFGKTYLRISVTPEQVSVVPERIQDLIKLVKASAN